MQLSSLHPTPPHPTHSHHTPNHTTPYRPIGLRGWGWGWVGGGRRGEAGSRHAESTALHYRLIARLTRRIEKVQGVRIDPVLAALGSVVHLDLTQRGDPSWALVHYCQCRRWVGPGRLGIIRGVAEVTQVAIDAVCRRVQPITAQRGQLDAEGLARKLRPSFIVQKYLSQVEGGGVGFGRADHDAAGIGGCKQSRQTCRYCAIACWRRDKAGRDGSSQARLRRRAGRGESAAAYPLLQLEAAAEMVVVEVKAAT